jgi:hypothetical protein
MPPCAIPAVAATTKFGLSMSNTILLKPIPVKEWPDWSCGMSVQVLPLSAERKMPRP